MKHKSYIHLILLQLIVLASCNQSQDGDYIKMDCTPTVETFISRIESISFCPLQTDDLHILGSNIDLLPVDDSFILVDRLNGSIFRYSADGSFLNQIGSKGRGPIEYVNIESVQWDSENECLIVFSKPDKVLFYSKDGSFIKSDAVPNKGLQSFYTENGVLTYYSYLPEMKYRAALLSEGDIKPYIPSEPIVMTYTSDVPVFSSNHDDVFLIDSYSNTLLKFSDDEMMPYLTFDFGKYSIPDSFYKYNDPYESVFFLNDSNFALINRYWESDVYRLVEVFIQTKEDVSYKYALCSKNEWSWFSEDKNHEFFSNSFRAIRDKQLFCLVSPEKLCTIPEILMDFGVDYSSLSTLSRESNYVVFTITLK